MPATAARTNAILKLKAGGRTRLIVFDTQDLSLGRASENDISVDDPEMSRRHAVFKRSREGCSVEDMGTSNGTAVNGRAVQCAVLKHGDVLILQESKPQALARYFTQQFSFSSLFTLFSHRDAIGTAGLVVP